MRSLNWLCVYDRITFLIAILTYRCLNGSAPSYLSRLIIPLNNSRSLRSSSSALLRVPRTRHANFGDRSFAKVAPSLVINCTRTTTMLARGFPFYMLYPKCISATANCFRSSDSRDKCHHSQSEKQPNRITVAELLNCVSYIDMGGGLQELDDADRADQPLPPLAVPLFYFQRSSQHIISRAK